MFPDVLSIATVREHSANVPGILRAGWVSILLLRNKSGSSGYKIIKINTIVD